MVTGSAPLAGQVRISSVCLRKTRIFFTVEPASKKHRSCHPCIPAVAEPPSKRQKLEEKIEEIMASRSDIKKIRISQSDVDRAELTTAAGPARRTGYDPDVSFRNIVKALRSHFADLRNDLQRFRGSEEVIQNPVVERALLEVRSEYEEDDDPRNSRSVIHRGTFPISERESSPKRKVPSRLTRSKSI